LFLCFLTLGWLNCGMLTGGLQLEIIPVLCAPVSSLFHFSLLVFFLLEVAILNSGQPYFKMFLGFCFNWGVGGEFVSTTY